MYYNVGVNVKKDLNGLIKRIKMPSIAHRTYYSYNYDGEPSYKDCCDNNDCCCLSDVFNCDIDKKKVALVAAGALLGIVGICLLRKKH